MTNYNSVRVSAVEGNQQFLDGGAMFGNAPRALWQRWMQADEKGRIGLSCRCLLIEYDDCKILCETGIGAYLEPALAERYGVIETDHMLLRNLEKIGVDPEAIDYVILSHLHFDHAGGLLPAFRDGGEKGDLLFPKARYVIGKEAWQRAQHPHPRDQASFIPGLAEKLKASGRLLIVEGDSLPGFASEHLWFRYSSGHTPGHMHTVVRGRDETMIFAGDLVPGRAWVHLPITMGYDRFAEQVIDEKQELYELAAPESWYLFFTHDPEVAAARIERDAKGRYTAVKEKKEMRSLSL